jgi:uncharacterized protein
VLIRDFNYTNAQADNISAKVSPFFEFVNPKEKIDIIKDDPEDNIILECACAADADFIISYDKHLLALGEFRKIRITKPTKFL